MDGVKMVSQAILGIDYETVVVNGQSYKIYPPTIEKIAGAGLYLSAIPDFKDFSTVYQNLQTLKDVSFALSWLIKGDESLADTLSLGTVKEITDALATAISMIGIENFLKLSALAKSVQSLIAVTR